MAKTRLLAVLLVAVVAVSSTADRGAYAQAPTVLLVTNSLTLGPGDTAVKNRLVGLGYSVIVMVASTTNSGHANGMAAVLISSTAPPADVNTKFLNVTTPVMTWQSSIYDDMKMTGVVAGTDFGTAPYFTELVIDDPGHPMAAGLSGIVTVTSALETFSWGEPSDNVWLIATLGVNWLGVEIDKAGIFGYEQAVAMVGMNAPARRLGMFMTANTAASFTADGWKLFDATLAWVTTQNQPPVVQAALGDDPPPYDPRDALELEGEVTSDDGLPHPPSALTYLWTKVSGPGVATFVSPTSLSTTVTFSAAGSYVLRLTANDTLLSGSDDVPVDTEYEDRPPVVNAGDDQTITLPATASLSGTATDEGLPDPPAALTHTWKHVVTPPNPETVIFSNPNALSTTATFPGKGIYILKLESTDGNHTSSDELTVTVNGTALLVRGNSQSAGDSVLQARLEALGFTTTVKTWAGATSGDASGKHVVVVAGSAVLGNPLTKFRDVTVPVVVSKDVLLDDMKMTGVTQNTHYGSTANQTQVTVLNSSHPMAAGLSGTVTATSTTASFFWGAPPAAQAVGSIVGNPTRLTVFGYETGAAMVGMNAPARRVGLFLSDAAAANLTSNGGLLFDAAIGWASATNLAPRVNAGPDTTALAGGPAINLSGVVSDDGLPNPPGVLMLNWSVTQGNPADVSFGNSNQAQTTVSFSSAATYVLRLSANDGDRVSFDELTVSVSNANQPPIVNAGTDELITLPAIANLSGAVSDDGLPNPPGAIQSVTWSKQSGPGTVTFGNANSVVTTATFSQKGVYELKLEASDGAATASDTMIVTVNGTALLVRGNSQSTGDSALQARLEALGFTTTVKSWAAATSGDASGKHVVVVAGSAVLGSPLTKFRDVTVPVVVSKDVLLDDMKMTGVTQNTHYGSTANQTQVTILSSSHPMAAGLSGSVTATSTTASFFWGAPPAAQAVASIVGNPTRLTVFGYETGAVMVGLNAPARRVGFFLSDAAAANLTSNGGLLFDAAVSWAAADNLAPRVSAGPDQMVILPTANLAGSASDDGLPSPPGALTITWSKQTGPGSVNFGNPNAAVTTATFSQAGSYILRLTASDGYFVVYDEAAFTVSATNQAPIVNAGLDQTLTLPAAAQLSAVAMDDGQPNPPGVMSFAWSKQSGPGTTTFGSPNSLVTTATFSEVGVYVLRLTASDGSLSGWDELTVTVNGDALLIVGSMALTDDDAVFQGHLEDLGYNVVVMDGASANSGNATGKVLVLIANSAVEADVNTKFRLVTVPVLVSRDPLFDDMSMTTSANKGNTGATESAVSIVAPTHPLAAGLTGLVTVVSKAAAFSWGIPSANGVKVATLATNNDGTVFAYEAGAAMQGLNAPARRVGFFAKGGVPENFTPEGGALLDAAIKWAAKANLPPTVSAGPDAKITLPTNQVNLAGSVGDDGLPNPPAMVTLTWSKLAGPAQVAFGSPNSAVTTATFSQAGIYVLELRGSDGSLSRADHVLITVDSSVPPPGGNTPPTVNAGVDQEVWFGHTTELAGTSEDDGQPNPPGGVTTSWSKLTGPGTVTFGDASALSTTATLSAAGTYVLRLTVSDSQLSATDDLIVTVLPNRKALLVTAAGTLGPGDAAVNSRLEADGFTVTVKADNIVVSNDANNKDIVIISSTTTAANVGAKFRTKAIPVLDCNADNYYDMAMTDVSDGGFTLIQTHLRITNPDHPISAWLSGTVKVTTDPATYAWGRNLVSTAAVAEMFALPYSGIFAFEKGETLPAALFAPARRVGFFSCDGSIFTQEGWALFDAAVDWATTPTVPALYVKNAGSGDEKALKRHLSSLGFDLTEKTDSQLVTGDADGKAVVYVSASASPSALGTKLQGVGTPVVTAAQANYPSMGMTGPVLETNYGFVPNQTQVQIFDPTHPLAGSLSGTQTVATAVSGDYGWGAPGPAAAKAATIVGFSYGATSFGYERGAPMVVGTAPARRVGLFMNLTTTDYFTFSGWALYDAALRWASGDDPDGDGLSTFDEYRLGTDPTDPDTNDDGLLDGAAVKAGKSPTNLDMDGDGVVNATELQHGSDPFNPDTDGDAVLDGSDCFPLDPTRNQCPQPIPGDNTPPTITLTEPTNAILISSVP